MPKEILSKQVESQPQLHALSTATITALVAPKVLVTTPQVAKEDQSRSKLLDLPESEQKIAFELY